MMLHTSKRLHLCLAPWPPGPAPHRWPGGGLSLRRSGLAHALQPFRVFIHSTLSAIVAYTLHLLSPPLIPPSSKRGAEQAGVSVSRGGWGGNWPATRCRIPAAALLGGSRGHRPCTGAHEDTHQRGQFRTSRPGHFLEDAHWGHLPYASASGDTHMSHVRPAFLRSPLENLLTFGPSVCLYGASTDAAVNIVSCKLIIS